jgi:hypothetical protein
MYNQSIELWLTIRYPDRQGASIIHIEIVAARARKGTAIL